MSKNNVNIVYIVNIAYPRDIGYQYSPFFHYESRPFSLHRKDGVLHTVKKWEGKTHLHIVFTQLL